MQQTTIDVLFSDKVVRSPEGSKIFCPMEKVRFPALKDLVYGLASYLERTIPNSTVSTGKTYYLDFTTHLNVGVSFQLHQDVLNHDEVKEAVLSFSAAVANGVVTMTETVDAGLESVREFLLNKSGKSIKKSFEIILDNQHACSLMGRYSDVISPVLPDRPFKMIGKICDLNHDKRTLQILNLENIKGDQIYFDVAESFRTLCDYYADQKYLILSVLEVPDTKGRRSRMLKAIEVYND